MTVLINIFAFLIVTFIFVICAIILVYLPYLLFKKLFKKGKEPVTEKLEIKVEEENAKQTTITISIDSENLKKLRKILHS